MLEQFHSVLVELPPLFIAVVFLFGLLVGSFLNVVIYRFPLIIRSQWFANIREILSDAASKNEKTGIEFIDLGCTHCQAKISNEELMGSGSTLNYSYLAWPPSSCPTCGYKIRGFQNIPVISWLFLRGKCAGCRQKINLQYPLIELLSGVLAGAIAWKYGVTLTTLFTLLLVWALIVATFIDFKYYMLPDEITLPFIWLGMILAYFSILPITLTQSFFGAIFGYLFFWIIYWLFKILFKKEGMGYGDFKLLSMLGAWFGVSAVFPIVLISTLCGSIIGISLILFYKHAKDRPIPFGPYLALAGIFYLFFSDIIIHIMPF